MELRRQMATLMKEKAETEEIIRILCQLVHQSEAEGLLAQWHPVGFIDIPISVNPITERGKTTHSTVHVWHPKFSRPQEPLHVCHSHGWHLASSVLYGDFINETYKVIDDPAANFMLYQVTYRSGVSISTATGKRVSARVSSQEHISQGTHYEIPWDSFHQTRTRRDSLVITAMTSSRLTGTYPMNVRLADSNRTFIYKRKKCPKEVQSSIFNDILSRFS